MKKFVCGLGGIEAATDAMNWLREKAGKCGLAGVDFQFIQWSMAISEDLETRKIVHVIGDGSSAEAFLFSAEERKAIM